MLASRTIRQLFSQMILFNGKMGYNPNTLNNRVHTYFLAHEWQKNNMEEGKKGNDVQEQHYSHEKWMQLIQSVSDFNIDYKILLNKDPKTAQLSLFYDWSVYGDMMLVPEYRAVAMLD